MRRLFKTFFLTIFLSTLVLADPGDLDLTFNGTGKATIDFGGSSSTSRAVVIQPDGKIVTAGYNYVASYVFALARYNQNGSLDTTFDGDGKVTTGLTGFSLRAFSVALQSDGKIVAAGVFNGFDSRFAVVRYNSDGSLDTTFDTDGIAFSPSIGAYNDGFVGIQQDGKIVVAGTGYFGSYDFCVVRFNANGSIDTSFDTDGVNNTSISPNWDYVNSMAFQSDGKIVVAGQSRNDTDGWDQIALVRYNADGSLDTTFDGDGKVTTTFGVVGSRFGSEFAGSVIIQPDGKITAAGSALNSGNGTRSFVIVRYNSDGSLDTSFDTDGKVLTPFGNFAAQANAAAIQPDGKIIAAGSVTNPSNSDFALVRYNPDGSLDNSLAANTPDLFGSGGKVTVDFSSTQDFAYAVTLDSSGKIIATGESGTSFGTIRLLGLAPTAANVSISGRVLTSDGRGLANAVVSLTDSNGATRTARTGSFGFYRFDEIQSGQTVIISVQAKTLQFAPRVLSVSEDAADVDFMPVGNKF